jgi:hypothetical protein
MGHKIGSAVICVDTSGVARVVMFNAAVAYPRLEGEGRRCADILARATPPPECGPEMIAAPGRGPTVAMALREVVRGEDGAARVISTGYSGRKPARAADAFDLMEDDNRRAHRRAGGKGQPVPLFTVGQVLAGREYAALVERVNSSGLSCAGVEAAGRGDGTGGGRQEAVFRDIERLRLLRHRIGDGIAREMRRYRPGDGRRAIRCLTLVDDVCVKGRSLEAVLEAHGWSVHAKYRAGLRTALCSALDRMRGYGLVRPTR